MDVEEVMGVMVGVVASFSVRLPLCLREDMFFVFVFFVFVLCFMFYVLCFMFYVLCFMFYVLCFG